jgi:hypothetical protein
MGKHIFIWLVIVLVMPIVFPAVMSPEKVSQYIRDDYKTAVSILGDRDELNSRLINLYRSNLTAIAKFANEFGYSHDDSDKFRKSGDHIGEAIADIPADWAESVKLQAYSIALRFSVLMLWLKWLILPMAMGGVAGVLERRLKKETFSPPLPPLYNTAAHVLIALGFITILWVICPIPLPVAIIPTAAVIATWFFSLTITHYPNY